MLTKYLPGGVFIVIFVGIFLACITLAIEYCYFKFWYHPDSDDSVTADTAPNNINNTNRVANKVYEIYFKSQILINVNRLVQCQDDIYGKSRTPYIIDTTKPGKEHFTPEYGYYGAKREAELE